MRSLTVLAGKKYVSRKDLDNSTQVVKELGDATVTTPLLGSSEKKEKTDFNHVFTHSIYL